MNGNGNDDKNGNNKIFAQNIEHMIILNKLKAP